MSVFLQKMASEIHEITEIIFKNFEQNQRVCGAANGEPRMGEGMLYMYICIYTHIYIYVHINIYMTQSS